MNVYVVSFDESENADDPLLCVYASRVLMERAVRLMAADTSFRPEVLAALEEGGDFTLMLWDEDTGDRLQIHLREVRVDEVETTTLMKGIL
jgi:hypothetical protein